MDTQSHNVQDSMEVDYGLQPVEYEPAEARYASLEGEEARLQELSVRLAELEASARGERLLLKYQEGLLTWEEYQRLPQAAKRAYRSRHRAPLSPSELRAREKRQAAGRARAQAQKQARKKQRQLQRQRGR